MSSVPVTRDRLLPIAHEACRIGMDHIIEQTAALADARSPIATKSSLTDIVTATDRSTENAIRHYLADQTPGARLLGEETGAGVLGDADGSDTWGAVEWVIDPIDGTVNFAYGVPLTAVSIGASVDGRPAVGVVGTVPSGEIFHASLGGGAFVDDVPITSSQSADLSMALIATGFSYQPTLRRRHASAMAALLDKVRDMRVYGSAALALCWVGCGRVDAYVERDIKPWDYAAGALIAAEAGARVELPCPENGNLVTACHPDMFVDLQSALADAEQTVNS